MAKPKAQSSRSRKTTIPAPASSSIKELLLGALERSESTLETGRYIATFKESAADEGAQSLASQGMRVANTRDFENQAVTLESVGDAGAVVFPEIGVALLGGDAVQEGPMSVHELAADSPIESIDPEYFVFAESIPAEYMRGFTRAAEGTSGEYLRGFLRAAETIARDLGHDAQPQLQVEEEALVLGATWGLIACKVSPSARSGAGIKVAVLDTGMDLGHADFADRPFVAETFVGQPAQDLHSHGTHCMGTACGPKAPPDTTPRYGIAHRSTLFVGKVLRNDGFSAGGSVLNGMNWAVANDCQVISLSLGSQTGVNPYYTAAGRAAMNKGLLIIAAAGNAGASTGSPANSPTIMSVASLDPKLNPSPFSNFGKIDISAPGQDVLSSIPMPRRYGVKNGTSMAAPHVAGCAALWAETSAMIRGMNLWRKLQSTARQLPFPPARVGAGLVQAP